MKVLCFSDLHVINSAELSFLSNINNSYDAVIFLGDISDNILEYIVEILPKDKPKIGILGNHDDFNAFEGLPIENINGGFIEVNGFTFAGIEGSFKYKNSTFPAFEQIESILFTSQLQKADVILSHTSPFGVNERDTHAHVGLLGISQYITRNKPLWNIHGHQHVNKRQTVGETNVQGVYGVVMLDLKTGEYTQLYK